MNNKIIGIEEYDLKVFSDNRGSVLKMISIESDYFTKFGECYFSEILPNTIKGWKKHNLQNQYITVPVGEIILVIYDDRVDSETFGIYKHIKLGRPENYKLIKISNGLWYAFKCISIIPALIVNCCDRPFEINESETKDFNYSI